MKTWDRVTVLDHPLVAHKMTLLRGKETSCARFRHLVSELTVIEAIEATRDVALEQVPVSTPVAETMGKRVANDATVVSILRAGNGMVDAMLDVLPFAHVGFLGMYRNEETHEPIHYYQKLPASIATDDVYLVDPMLATGGSAEDAIAELRKNGCKKLKFLCIVAAPEGVERLLAADPDVEIYCCVLDDHLNEDAYIVPGLGDAGDRIFNTFDVL